MTWEPVSNFRRLLEIQNLTMFVPIFQGTGREIRLTLSFGWKMSVISILPNTSLESFMRKWGRRNLTDTPMTKDQASRNYLDSTRMSNRDFQVCKLHAFIELPFMTSQWIG